MENAIQKATAKNILAAKNSKANQSVSALLNSTLDKEGYRNRFNDLLGERAPQFVSSIVSMINADAKLDKAFREAPITVIQAALKAATFDLPIDQSLGYAYIIPFDNNKKQRTEANFILGWKGMHQMALRSGVYQTINVLDVRQGEFVSYDRLTGDLTLNFIEDEDERDKLPIVGYAGYYRLVNGAEKKIYMTKKQVEAHERKYRKGQYMGKGWKENFDAMALKTVYRQLIGKWGIMSIDYKTSKESINLANQMAEEDAMLESDEEISVDFSVENVDNEPDSTDDREKNIDNPLKSVRTPDVVTTVR